MEVSRNVDESQIEILDRSMISDQLNHSSINLLKKQKKGWESILKELSLSDNSIEKRRLIDIRESIIDQLDDPMKNAEVLKEANLKSGIFSVSEKSGLLVVGCFDGKIFLYNISENLNLSIPKQVLVGHQGAVVSIDISSDSSFIVSGSRDNTAQIWRLDHSKGEYKMGQTFKHHKQEITSVFISKDMTTIISSSKDKKIAIWKNYEKSQKENDKKDKTENVFSNSRSKKYVLAQELHGHAGSVNGVCLSLNNKFIVSCSGDNTIKKWRYYYEEEKFILEESLIHHTEPVNCLCMSEDDQIIISGSEDASIIIWGSEGIGSSHEMIVQLSGHLAAIMCVAISNDKKLILSGSMDSTIKIWSGGSETYSLKQTLRDHQSAINSI